MAIAGAGNSYALSVRRLMLPRSTDRAELMLLPEVVELVGATERANHRADL